MAKEIWNDIQTNGVHDAVRNRLPPKHREEIARRTAEGADTATAPWNAITDTLTTTLGMKIVTLFEVVEREVVVDDPTMYTIPLYNINEIRRVHNPENAPLITQSVQYLELPVHKVYKRDPLYGVQENLVAFDPKFERIFNAPFAARADEAVRKANARATDDINALRNRAEQFWKRSLIMRLILAVEGPNHPLNRI